DVRATIDGPDAPFSGPDTTLLFQSDGAAGANPQLNVHLQPGTYYLVIGPSPAAAGAAAAGDYLFDLTYTASLQPNTTPVGTDPKVVAVGDFNGDGTADVATAGGGKAVTVQFGLGDGTVRDGVTPTASGSPTALVATHPAGDA